MKQSVFFPGLACLLLMAPVNADQLISDDAVVQGSSCIGSACSATETFGYSTLKIKAESPLVHFDDTSSSGSFPSNDWKLGVSDETSGEQASFYIEDATAGLRVFEISPDGDIALGSLSDVVSGAVSVGSDSASRRVAFVADPVDDTDAVNLRTATAMIDADVSADDRAAVEAAITALSERLDSLAARIYILEN